MAKTAQINIGINTQSAIKSIGDLNNELGGTISTVNDLKIASRALQEQLESTPVGTAQYEQLKNALIDVNTQIKNYDLSIEALDNEKLATEIKSVTGGLIDMVGGLSLIGVSSSNIDVIAKKFAKVEGISRAATGAIEAYQSGAKILNSILAKSGAAQAVLNAATTTQAVVATEAAVAEGAQAVATTAVGNASLGASVKFKALTAAMMANPFIAIATAIIAVVGAIIMFNDSEEEAAAQTEKLNKKLDENLASWDKANKIIQANSEQYIRRNQAIADSDLIFNQQRIDQIEQLETRTKQQNETLKTLYAEREVIQGNLIAKQAREQVDAAQREINTDTNKIKLLKQNNEDLANAFNKLSDEEALKAQEKAKENDLEIIDLQENIKLKQDLLKKDATGRNVIQIEASNQRAQLSQDINNKLLDIDKQYQKQLDDAEKERRKKQLDYITDKLNREKNASDTLLNLKTNEIKDLEEKELRLQENTFSTQKDELIKKASERELRINEEKYRNLDISEANYQQNKLNITNKGVENLSAEEKKLYDYFIQLNDDRIKAITTRFTVEQNVTAAETRKINATRKQLEIEYAKELEIYDANKITDVKEREAKILEINKEYKQKEIENINNSKKAESDILEAQYQKDISNANLTAQQKLKIDEQYELDKLKLSQDTSKKINEIEVENALKTETVYDSKLGKIMKKSEQILAATSQLVSKAISDLQLLFDTQAQQEQVKREAQFSADSEALKAQLANRLLTEQQYNEQVSLLQQKKNQEELAAKRKAFQQNKALSIANAAMSTAQAVISAFNAGASLGPAGIIAGPAFAAVAGVLGAAEIAIIASQKFTASKGGIVPSSGGGASNIDSVPSLLAPGEAVINADATARFAPLLSMMNMSTGGRQLAPSMDFIQSNSNSNRVYNSENQAVRAYVVENDITSSQRRIRRYEENSSF